MTLRELTTATALGAMLFLSPNVVPGANVENSSAKASKQSTKTALVRTAQTKLKSMGYYEGAVDGVKGPETDQAVRKYQQAQQLKVNGKLNKRTLASLGIDKEAIEDSSRAEGKAERVGEKAGRATGKAVDKTADAVADTGEAAGKGVKKGGKEVSKAGDPVDKGFDKAGEASGGALETGLNKAGDGVEAAIEGTGKGLKKAGGAIADVFDGDDKPEGGAAAEGDTHEAADMTRHAQQKLREKGFYSGEVDGIMGPETQDALRSYQSKHDLPVTGRLDAATIDKLDLD